MANNNIRDVYTTAAELNRLSEISDFVAKSFRNYGFGEEYIKDLAIVVEEIFVNIASYAYSDREPGDVIVECGTDGDCGVLVFKDHGIPYDPTLAEDPVIGDPLGMTIGGYGLFMVRQIMDEIRYSYDETEKENILSMRKQK